jgi:hypothetical protein
MIIVLKPDHKESDLHHFVRRIEDFASMMEACRRVAVAVGRTM